MVIQVDRVSFRVSSHSNQGYVILVVIRGTLLDFALGQRASHSIIVLVPWFRHQLLHHLLSQPEAGVRQPEVEARLLEVEVRPLEVETSQLEVVSGT